MLRRSPASTDFKAYVEELASVRGDFFGRIRQELLSSSDGLLDEKILDEFIFKRNWLMHHLISDPRYISTAKNGGFDLSAEINFFTEKMEYFGDVYNVLATKAGVVERAKKLLGIEVPVATSLMAAVNGEMIRQKAAKRKA